MSMLGHLCSLARRRIITDSRTFILQHPYIPRPVERQLLGVGKEVKQWLTSLTDEREQIDITCQRGRLPWSIHLDSFSMMSHSGKQIKSAFYSLHCNRMIFIPTTFIMSCFIIIILKWLLVSLFFCFFGHNSACSTFSTQIDSKNASWFYVGCKKTQQQTYRGQHTFRGVSQIYWAKRSQCCRSPCLVDDKHSFVSVTDQSIKRFLHTARIFNPLCLASALRWLIHTYVSLMRQGQRLLGWNVGLLLRGKECVSAFLNVKPLWLKKHKAYYACICSLGRGCYCCG